MPTNSGSLRAGEEVSAKVQAIVDLGADDFGPSPSSVVRAQRIAEQAGHDMEALLSGWKIHDVANALGLL